MYIGVFHIERNGSSLMDGVEEIDMDSRYGNT